MNNMLQTIRSNGMIIVLLFLTALFVTAAVARIFIPNETAPPSSIITENQTQFNDFTYTGPEQDFPTSLPLADAKLESFLGSTFFEDILARYSMEPHPRAEGLWIGNRFSLDRQEGLDSYLLTRTNVEVDENIASLDTAEAIQTANEFIESVFEITSLQPFNSEIAYYGGESESYIEVNASRAQQAAIPFGFTIQGVPIYFNRSLQLPMVVTVDGNNTVRKASFQQQFYTIEPNRSIPLLSYQAALDRLEEDDIGSVLLAGTNSIEAIDERTISDGALSSVSLEYRIDPASREASPYYRFTGTARDRNDIEIAIVIITPAYKLSQ